MTAWPTFICWPYLGKAELACQHPTDLLSSFPDIISAPLIRTLTPLPVHPTAAKANNCLFSPLPLIPHNLVLWLFKSKGSHLPSCLMWVLRAPCELCSNILHCCCLCPSWLTRLPSSCRKDRLHNSLIAEELNPLLRCYHYF